MQWNSLIDFLMMNGHGVFVFSAYGLVLVAFLCEMVQLRARIKTALKRFNDQKR